MPPHGRCISTRGLWRLACRTVQPAAQPRGHTRRYMSVKYQAFAKCSTPIAQKLKDAEIWSPSRHRKKIAISNPEDETKNKYFNMDTSNAKRVNIVSEKLCDDIIKRLKRSLHKHKRCDLLDLNPGTCLWSRALHDVVKPRRHIMMEPIPDYASIRKEVMGKRQFEVVEKDGFLWPELEETMDKYLGQDHQKVRKGEEPQDHKELLVTANMATFPKRAAYGFPSLASMVMYQIFSNISHSRLFQQYGNVRMLIWADDDMARKIVPRSASNRRRPAFESELSCKYIHQVAGLDVPESELKRFETRDRWIDLESMANVLKKMEEKKVVTPPGRETKLMKTVQANPNLRGVQLAGNRAPLTETTYTDELEELETAKADGKIKSASTDMARLSSLRHRAQSKEKNDKVYLDFLQLHDKMMKVKPSSQTYNSVIKRYHNRTETLSKNHQDTLMTLRDGHHLFRHHKVPPLFWDQRPYEPLAVDPLEFYPNSPCCLLDIQPKTMHPILRQHGRDTSRSGDYSTIILRDLWSKGGIPVYPEALDAIWPGFSSMVDHCPSIFDRKHGGFNVRGEWGFNIRSMTEKHWVEIMEAFMRWPFRPPYLKMLGRTGSEIDLDPDMEFLKSLPGAKQSEKEE